MLKREIKTWHAPALVRLVTTINVAHKESVEIEK